MTSMYRRQFVMMASMILISFALLGAVFVALSYNYTLRDKRENMDRNAVIVAEYVSDMTQRAVVGDVFFDTSSFKVSEFQLYIRSAAKVSSSHVIFCLADGTVVYSSKDDGNEDNADYGFVINDEESLLIAQGNASSGFTNLSGLLPERRYVAGAPVILNAFGGTHTLGYVYVTAEPSSITEMWSAFSTIFFFAAFIVMCIAFISSSVTSMYITKPLKEMATVAKRFARGEFNARVEGYEQRYDEIGELAGAFNQMAENLETGEGKRSDFIANISHEMRTPMTTIAGFADGILDGTIPQEKAEGYLKIISQETRRLSRLVRRMLDLSRLESVEAVTTQEQFDINELLVRTLVSLESKISGRGLDVDIEDIPKKPTLVWGDPDNITQVCYNLLDNAIKHAYDRGKIFLSVEKRGGKAYISVRNEGDSIPAGQLSHLFDRFHKVDLSRGRDPEGVGLGLYIVKTILDNHKEKITVVSEGGLTEFTFTLTLV